MARLATSMNNFWNELKKRGVVRVIIVYATSAFVLIELANNITDPLNLPVWFPTVVIIVLLIGFPLAVILAWFNKISSKGISRKASPHSENSAVNSVDGHSILVLPFQNMSPDKDQEYFCDGITEEIINALVHVKSLKVIARTTAFAYKGKFQDVREIGSKLNVSTVLEGSVRKSGNRLRITAQLIDVSDGVHLLSETYDREVQDVFAIQDEISLAIVKKLQVELFEEEKKQILKIPTENQEAYHLLLKGRHFLYNQRSKEGLSKSETYFQKAIDVDAKFALAYAELANTYSIQVEWGYLHPVKTQVLIRDLLSKSLEIDDTIPEAYITQVYQLGYIGLEWEKVFYYTSRALELKQNSPGVHHWNAMFLMAIGEFDKAEKHNEIARNLDPLSTVFNFAYALILHMAGKADQSLNQFEKVNLLDPDFVVAHFWATFPRIRWGREEEAVKGYQKLLLKDERTESLSPVIWDIYQKDGIEGFLHWLIDEGIELDKGVYNHPYWKAICFALLHETDAAFTELEKVFELRSPRMVYCYSDSCLDSIRSDPRYTSIQNRLNIPKLV